LVRRYSIAASIETASVDATASLALASS